MLIFFKNEIDKETSLVELYLYIDCSEDFFFFFFKKEVLAAFYSFKGKSNKTIEVIFRGTDFIQWRFQDFFLWGSVVVKLEIYHGGK